jgi:HEAT repeat protein
MDWLKGTRQGEVKKLIARLSDSAKRDSAAQELITIGEDSVPALLGSLQTQDVNLVETYQQILARIPGATLALTYALRTAHPLVRGRVLEVLGLRQDKTVIADLLDALKSEYFTVRSRAALVLGSFGDAKVIPELLPLLEDDEDEVRIAACTTLGKYRDPATFYDISNILLDDPKIEVRRAAAKALGETKHPAAAPYLLEAIHDSIWWYEREKVDGELTAAIENMGAAVIDPLIQALGDNEGTVRKLAATLLGNLGDERAIDMLGMTLFDLHHEVGEAAAQALVKFGPQAVEVLFEALSHPEAGIREAAVRALGQIQDARVAPVLIEKLKDPDRLVKSQAMRSLGILGDRNALPPLQEIFSDRSDRELSSLAKKIIEMF